MLQMLLIGVLAATAARVFVPDAVRLVRRGLAAGVMAGVASLTERGRDARPQPPASEAGLSAEKGERA
ncbi:hypothetical protein [Streptomyces iconiensis]|uniref:Uncharacterized protein n=1 Tax=Streptomyces iconiensis TaxID=1384038 RepID=A0ABT7A263_9ACTN|nr:hypothetical protein [Streptomyces iconiensis]MDJ1135424.1 hypothetical protein [Streptomyces iconiensis]